jgi:hypothetical protein
MPKKDDYRAFFQESELKTLEKEYKIREDILDKLKNAKNKITMCQIKIDGIDVALAPRADTFNIRKQLEENEKARIISERIEYDKKLSVAKNLQKKLIKELNEHDQQVLERVSAEDQILEERMAKLENEMSVLRQNH